MPAPRLRYLGEARREVDEAFDWYLARSRQAAEAFVRELEHAAILIAESPGVWPRYERESRRYVLRRFPFDLIYESPAA
jgi:plasmid stabilization system protein ParE